MNKIIYILILVLTAANLQAQQVKAIDFSRQDSAEVHKFIDNALREHSEGHYRSESDNYNNIAMKYWEHNQFKKAIENFNISLKINKNLQNENAIAMINSNLALIYADMRKFKEALAYFENTYSIRKSKKEKVGIISALINMSVVHNNLKEYDKSVTKLTEALDIAREMNDAKQMFSCYGMLSETYEKKGDIENSIKYYNLFRTFYDMVHKKQIEKTTSELENEKLRAELAESQKKQKELELLSKQKELNKKDEQLSEADKKVNNLVENLSKQELATKVIEEQAKVHKLKAEKEIERSQRIRNITLLAIIFVIIVAIILLIAYKRKKQDNEKLAHQNEEIKSQNEEINQQKEEIQTQSEHITLAYEKLKELDDLKKGLTEMIVHDIKNPAGTVIKLAEKEPVKYAGKSILNLVENIMDVQKYENSEIPLNKSNFLLYSAANNCINQVSYLAKEKNINIINSLNRDIAVNADEEVIERVILNLLTNAIKFTPQNGRIEIGIKSKSNKEYRIFVKDNGTGIPENAINNVFDKFSQVISRKSGLARSTGLGLTFCKMAIEAHKCKIGVDSELNKGSEFWFVLNASKEKIKNTNIIPENKKVKIVLSDKDNEYLKKHIEEYAKYDIYDIVPLRKITESIDGNFSKSVKLWKETMETTVYNCNEELYTKMLTSQSIELITT